MTRLKLQISKRPDSAELFVKFRQKDGGKKRWIASVDTGAEVSVLPREWLSEIDYRLTERGTFVIQQAGIAKLTGLEVIEVTIEVSLEDRSGIETGRFEAPFWFMDTDRVLIGFEGILDRAILHIDMPQLSGYLEFDL